MNIAHIRRFCAPAISAAALLATASAASAFGLGKPPDVLTLGDALDVRIPLRLEPGEELPDACVTADVYFGEDRLPPGVVRARVVSTGAGERVVQIQSTSRIREPVVSLYVAIGCTTKLSRKFVVLADPPLVAPATGPVKGSTVAQAGSLPPVGDPAPHDAGAGGSTGSASSAVPADRADGLSATSRPPVQAAHARRSVSPDEPQGATPAPASPASVARAARSSSRRGGRPEATPPAATTRVAGLDAEIRSRAAGARSPAAGAGTRAGGPRLQLDPVEASALADPTLRLSMEIRGLPTAEQLDAPERRAQRDAAAAVWRALNATPEDMARDRQRLQELEARLAQLQKDTSGARQTVAALQARVAEAQSRQVRNPLVYGLAALSAALAAALGWMLWRRREERERAPWWGQDAASAEPPAGEARVEPDAGTGGPQADALVSVPSAQQAAVETASIADRPAAPAAPVAPTSAPTAVEAPRAHHLGAHAAAADAQPARHAATAVAAGRAGPQPVEEAKREVSVEELIDLEQQAEFFMVLGQDQSAIDLLESHIETTSGSSPLPYLKLLELYRRVDDRDRYESVRERFNSRFASYAPAWGADAQEGGHTLADYPGVVERLQALWSMPERAMAVLQASLLKREPGDEPFDLPAYRELLMLYSVARDLAERERQEAVDLLLPIDGAGMPPPAEAADTEDVERLLATRPVPSYPAARRPLQVDVQLPDLAASASPAPVDVDVALDDLGLPPAAASGPEGGAGSSGPAGVIEFEPTDAPGPGAIRRGGGSGGSGGPRS